MATHRTSQGKTIDMDNIRLKNEKVRAVGNMNVNAAGDVIDSDNQPISSRSSQVNHQYNQQTTGAKVPILSKKASPKAVEKVAEKVVGLDEPVEEAATDDDIEAVLDVLGKVSDLKAAMAEPVEEAAPEPEVKEVSGLAAAIAKAREVKQEPMKTVQEEERSITGVKKI